MDLYGKIMNLQSTPIQYGYCNELATAYSLGHRDSRHAAAELALEAAACIDALRDLLLLHQTSTSPQNKADGWNAAREALAALER